MIQGLIGGCSQLRVGTGLETCLHCGSPMTSGKLVLDVVM